MGTWRQKTPDPPHASRTPIAGVPLQLPAKPTIALCVAVLNEGPDLEATIATAIAAKDPPNEIVVVDDGSKQPVAPRLAPWMRLPGVRVQVVTHSRRQGSGPSKHEAMRLATSDIVCVADSHMRFPWDWTSRVIAAVRLYPYSVFSSVSIGFEPDSTFCGTGCFFDFNPKHGFWTARWGSVEDIAYPRIPCVHGGFYAVTRGLLKHLGGYTPAYKGWGVEEEYLSLRAYLLGFDCRLIHDLRVAHNYQRKPDRQDCAMRPESTLDPLHNRHVAARVCFGEDVYAEIYRPSLERAHRGVDVDALLAETEESWRTAQAVVQGRVLRSVEELRELCGVEHPPVAVSL